MFQNDKGWNPVILGIALSIPIPGDRTSSSNYNLVSVGHLESSSLFKTS